MCRLERLLGIDRHRLRALASQAETLYSPFSRSKKPKPFERKRRPRKLRVIDNPSEELKAVQTVINDRLLRPIALPPNICGGVKGKSVLDNVRWHAGNPVLVKVDIARFFPSITKGCFTECGEECWAALPDIGNTKQVDDFRATPSARCADQYTPGEAP